MVLFYILISVIIVSLIAFIGIFFLAMKQKFIDKLLLHLVAFASGALLGGAFLHLIPESLEGCGIEDAFLYVLIGFFLFFLIEKFLYWRHCHKGECDIHAFTYLNLIGDGVHNFIDGLIIAAAYLVNIPLGISTTFAIIIHEVPQEIGDFGVLVYGGFTKWKALFYNFLSALAAVIGAVVGFFFINTIEGLSPFLLSFAAGGFIYIAATDLIPELHKKKEARDAAVQALLLFIGIAFMYALKMLG